MVLLQVARQHLRNIALTGTVTDQYNLLGGCQRDRHLLIKRGLLGNPIAAVVGFLAVDEVVMKMVRIVRLDADSILNLATAYVAVDVCAMVINYNHHPTRLGRLRFRRVHDCVLEKLSQPGYLLGAKFGGARTFKDFPLLANNKCGLVFASRFHVTQVSNEIQCVAPMHRSGQLSVEQTLMKSG